MLIQSGEWCNDKNVMLFIRLDRSFPHDVLLSDLLPKKHFSVKLKNSGHFRHGDFFKGTKMNTASV